MASVTGGRSDFYLGRWTPGGGATGGGTQACGKRGPGRGEWHFPRLPDLQVPGPLMLKPTLGSEAVTALSSAPRPQTPCCAARLSCPLTSPTSGRVGTGLGRPGFPRMRGQGAGPPGDGGHRGWAESWPERTRGRSVLNGGRNGDADMGCRQLAGSEPGDTRGPETASGTGNVGILSGEPGGRGGRLLGRRLAVETRLPRGAGSGRVRVWD